MSQQTLYVVTVTYYKPLDVFVGGVYYDEAIIHRRLAREKGYHDAQIWDQESFKKEKAAQRRGAVVAGAPSASDRLLHDLRSQSDSALALHAAGLQ